MKSKNTLHKRILTGILWCAVIFTLIFSMLQYFGVSFDVSAGYARTLPFQGRLTNPNGTNVTNGKYDMKFSIFNTSNQAVTVSPLWDENHSGINAVTVEDSVFNVLLGRINPINIDFNSGTYWLEIQVGGEILSPRRQIGGTGYSINTDNVTGIPGSINDTNLDAFPAAERAVVDALNYLLGQINTYGLWTDTGTALRPRAGASGNVSIPGGTLSVSGATTLGSTLTVSGAITGPTSNTINGVSINSGTITAGTWNGTQISDNYIVALAGASQGDVLYHNGTQWTQLSAGVSGNFLMTQGAGANPIWNSVGGGALADGTVVNSTLHWNGGAWAENTTILTTATSVYGSGALTVYSTSADLTLSTNTSGNVLLDSAGGYIQAQDNFNAVAGIDITNAPLTMGTQNITGVGTNITATGALTITSVGAGNDLSLVSADKIYFQDALITTQIPFALTDNTAAFESAFAAADRGVVDALISLASGGTGLWLDNVGADYLYPNSTYSNNVAVSSGIMSIGTTPTAGQSLSISNSANNGYAVYAVTGDANTGTLYGGYFASASTGATTQYGIYGYARRGAVDGTAIGVYGLADGPGGGSSNYGGYFSGLNTSTPRDNYGIYTEVRGGNVNTYAIYGKVISDGGTSYGGYFDSNSVADYGVYITGAARESDLYVDGDTYISSGLGVGVEQDTDGYIQANTRIGVAMSPGYPLDVTGQARISTNLAVNGVNPNALYGVYANTGVSSGRAVYGQANAVDGTTYGVYGSSTGANVVGGIHYGVYASATGSGGLTTNYAFYATASGGTTNWAGYFGAGNVYITNQLGIGASPSYPLHVAGDAYITSGLGVGVAQTNDGYIQANERIGIGVAPSYRLHVYDQTTNLQYAQYVDFRSTYAGDKAAIYGANASAATAGAGAIGVMGSATGASSAEWNIGVYGTANNNSSQTVGVWGQAQGGSGSSTSWDGSWGGFFEVSSAATGNQYGVLGYVESAKNTRLNMGVKGMVDINTSDLFTTWESDSAFGVLGELSFYQSADYLGNYPEMHSGDFVTYIAPGVTLQRLGSGGLQILRGTIFNDGTISNASEVGAVVGTVSGSATATYSGSTTWLRGISGYIHDDYFTSAAPTYTDVRAVGLYGSARNTNSTGVNYGVYTHVENARNNYGAYFHIEQGGSLSDYGVYAYIEDGGANNDYVAYFRPGSNVEYGVYVASGATTRAMYVDGSGEFTTSIISPNKAAAVSDIVRNDSGEVLHEGDVVVLTGADTVHYLFDGKTPVPRVRKSQGPADGDKLFGVMFQSHTGDRYEIQPNEYGFAFTMNAIRKVNVSGENGAIAVGDQLALAAVPGHVKKADPGENVLGLALKSYNSGGLGQIPVFVQLQYRQPTVAQTSGGKIEAGTMAGDLGITGNLTVDGNVDITGTLKAASLWSQNATWHLDSQGELFVQKVETQELAIAEGPNKSLGGVVLPAGLQEIFVTNTSVTTDSRIFLTIESEGELVAGVKIKEKRAGEGFVIATGDDLPVAADLEINWLIIN